MSLKQDVQTLRDIYDGLTAEEKAQAVALIPQLAFAKDIFERSDGLMGAVMGLAVAAKLRGEDKVKEAIAEAFADIMGGA